LQLLRTRLLNRECFSRVALGLGIEDRIRVGKGRDVSQAVCEDVVEAIAGAIVEELGYPELYAWTELTLGPMVEIYKDSLKSKLSNISGLPRSSPFPKTEEAEATGKNPLKRADYGCPPVEPPPHSRADLIAYCQSKSFHIVVETVAKKPLGKKGSQYEWVEAITVEGKWRAEGSGTSRKKSQAAAAEALKRSGLLPDYEDFE
jgi:dsRNA-specific ribonuclease